MMRKKSYIYIIITLIIPFWSFAANCSSTGSGNWSSPSTWSCGYVPGCGDVIIITAGTTVTVDVQEDLSACSSPITLNVNGVLLFTTGFKVKLPTGSVVNISSTGSLNPGGGGGNSNLIEIGTDIVWTTSAGTVTGPIILLPIELVSFTAEKEKNKVKLNWITATESNNDYFTIEKTIDGVNYQFVQTIDGAGNSIITHNYEAYDSDPYDGISYYRLKQTDYDGNYTYSSLVFIDYTSDFKTLSVNVFPNPNDGSNITLSVEAEKSASVLISICDVMGQICFSKSFEEGGKNLFDLNLANKLNAGVYTINVSSGKYISNKKLIVR